MKRRCLSILAVIMLAAPVATFAESGVNTIDNTSADNHLANKHSVTLKDTSKKQTNAGEKVADTKKHKRPIAKIAYPKKYVKPGAKVVISKKNMKPNAKLADPKKHLKFGEKVS